MWPCCGRTAQSPLHPGHPCHLDQGEEGQGQGPPDHRHRLHEGEERGSSCDLTILARFSSIFTNLIKKTAEFTIYRLPFSVYSLTINLTINTKYNIILGKAAI